MEDERMRRRQTRASPGLERIGEQIVMPPRQTVVEQDLGRRVDEGELELQPFESRARRRQQRDQRRRWAFEMQQH